MSAILRHPWRTASIAGFVFGGSASAFSMVAAWSHNPQNEFHEESLIHWNSWLTIGFSWFLVVGLTVFIGLRASLFIAEHFNSRGST